MEDSFSILNQYNDYWIEINWSRKGLETFFVIYWTKDYLSLLNIFNELEVNIFYENSNLGIILIV